jgi:hypothetical protein
MEGVQPLAVGCPVIAVRFPPAGCGDGKEIFTKLLKFAMHLGSEMALLRGEIFFLK